MAYRIRNGKQEEFVKYFKEGVHEITEDEVGEFVLTEEEAKWLISWLRQYLNHLNSNGKGMEMMFVVEQIAQVMRIMK